MASPEILRCSFCGKSQDEVRKLIAGPAVMICDECVEVCVDVIFDDAVQPADKDPQERERWRAIAAKVAVKPESSICSLCGTAGHDMLSIGSRGLLCGDCADAIEDVLSQGKPIS